MVVLFILYLVQYLITKLTINDFYIKMGVKKSDWLIDWLILTVC